MIQDQAKLNVLLNFIKHQRPDFDKIYLYIKNPFESKRQILINGREKVRIIKLKNPKVFIDYSQIIDDVYENLEDYNPTKKMRVLIAFDDMTADMESNRILNPVVTELLLKGRKLNISLVLYHNLISKLPKTIRLNVILS